MLVTAKNYKFWFCTGSQDLYGDECLAHVAEHSRFFVEELNKSGNLPFEVVWQPTLITNEGSGMRRRDYVDAYVFTGQELDPRASGIQKTAVPSAHSV